MVCGIDKPCVGADDLPQGHWLHHPLILRGVSLALSALCALLTPGWGGQGRPPLRRKSIPVRNQRYLSANPPPGKRRALRTTPCPSTTNDAFYQTLRRQTGRRGRRPLRTISRPLPNQRFPLSSLPTGKRALHEAPLRRNPIPCHFQGVHSTDGFSLFPLFSSLKNPPIHYYNNCTHLPFTASGFFVIIPIMYYAIDCAPLGREEGRT